MRLTWNETETEFQDSVARTLEDAGLLAHVRHLMDDKRVDARHLAVELASLGTLEAPVPEAYGGLGLGCEPVCLTAFELGKRLSPLAFSPTAGLGLVSGIVLGKPELIERFRGLRSLAAGLRLYFEDRSKNSPCMSGNSIDGEVPIAADAVDADTVIVAAMDAADRATLALVDLKGPGVTCTPLPSIDPTRGVARLSFSGASAVPLATGIEAMEAANRLMQHYDLFLAFEQVGGAVGALEMACVYARERQAFGQPIGAFQAIKHKLADIYTKNEIARAHARYAADRLSNKSDAAAAAVACARASASDAFLFAAKEALHVHGGIGFTFDSDCHLFYRRARYLSAIGTPQLDTLETVAQRVIASTMGEAA